MKNVCSALVLPDGGLLSLIYYLDCSFPLKVLSLWNDCQGVLKQKVPSPNPQLCHRPLVAGFRDFSSLKAEAVLRELLVLGMLSFEVNNAQRF
jgi:hypothetical protein